MTNQMTNNQPNKLQLVLLQITMHQGYLLFMREIHACIVIQLYHCQH
jgi:hypothetical protein